MVGEGGWQGSAPSVTRLGRATPPPFYGGGGRPFLPRLRRRRYVAFHTRPKPGENPLRLWMEGGGGNGSETKIRDISPHV
jgi:hypothetical protein